ncbi:lamin tail domain-containing protein [Actinacidiphila oryziradicis]|uniref:Lamin tail domain-containing protein n=1 Tax=Actinacidiphila oryziradicis TaxID=2571141 RepID=A0A4U0RH47_9ACTN|nr:lamin tail domain-containing protein [Actinacidiphila oryziradicis]TJZ94436.1 lamin tail domain-containing protein [Actinacidiphila oryziradicis]
MRHRITATLLVAAAAFTGLATAAPAQAAGSVHLTEIYYNSPGSDNRSKASLNAEWVLIKNSTSKGVSLKGWTLTDASSHKYTFGTYTLGAGKSVKIHTGKGTNTATNRYQQRAAYVWNNDKDKATLKRSSGAVQDTCSYNSTKVAYKMC